MSLEMRYYGDPILRQKAKEVGEITEEIRGLIQGMKETMRLQKGVGLAAPQVGVLLRIFISNIDYEDDEGEVHYLAEPTVYINPLLSSPSEVLIESSEGCLSIPGLHANVIRPLSIVVEATDLSGNRFKKECSRYLARCMMHENDHLNGVLFVDRIKGKMRDKIEVELKKIKQKFYKER